MADQETGYDYRRYLRLLADAVDETKRLALIDVLIRERARERLQAQRIADRVATTTVAVAQMLGPFGRRDHSRAG
jgi:hypothetical protein